MESRIVVIMNLFSLLIPGIAVGLPLGYVLQRTRLCFNSMYREWILHRRTALLRMVLLAVGIQMVGLYLLIQFRIGGVSVNIVPFYWLAAMLGGFIFGIAMVYAEGCSSTVWYRVGNGNMGALITLIGFAIGEWLLRFGYLNWFLERLQTPEIQLSSGEPTTLPNALGITPWWIILPLVTVLAIWLRGGKKESYLNGWDWKKGGALLGIIGVFAWVASWPSGWAYGVGIVGATGELIEMFNSGPQVLNWGSFLVLSLPLGAFLAAWRKKELRLQIPDIKSSLRMLIAGFMMGLSATIAGGCNIGHGFTGIPTLALSSLTATLFTFLGAWLGNYLRFERNNLIALKDIHLPTPAK